MYVLTQWGTYSSKVLTQGGLIGIRRLKESDKWGDSLEHAIPWVHKSDGGIIPCVLKGTGDSEFVQGGNTYKKI